MIDRPIRERVFFLDDHDYPQLLPKPVSTRRRPVSMITDMHPNGNPPFPVPSPVRRLSVHRPLRSSPLAGPALSSEGLVIPDEDNQRRCKPSRISSSPELPSVSSYSSIYAKDCLSSPHLEIAPRPRLNQRNSSPSYLAVPDTSLSKSPSASSLHIPLTSASSAPTSRSSPRPPSREGATPVSPATPTLPRSAPAVSGEWLITNTFGEIPRFSRVNMGPKVVMPVSAKEYRRKSISSIKSIPDLSNRASSPPGSIMRSRSGTSGVSSEEPDNTCSEPVRRVQSRKSISSLASKVRRRASTLLSIKSDSSQSIESALSILQSSSVTSLSSVADNSDVDFLLSPSLPPRAPSSAHSRGSSNSDCAIIDEEAEDVPPNPDYAVSVSYARSLPEKRKEGKRERFLRKFRRIVGAHRLIRPRVSDVS
ncbi:hypothetical protein GGU11DRAFT_529946 [Lentinula aff. detonsa]|nr:hypothetical protein GGU11DRAFT_529946 [Lentinula aff. detonsa]